MAEEPEKRCLVAVDTTRGPLLFRVALPAAGTIEAALAQARNQIGPEQTGAPIDWDGAVTGIWGVRCERSAMPRDGDRIELYLPLAVDPRQRRRQRARAARR